MIEVAPYLFGITLDVRFPKPRPFSKQRLNNVLGRLIDNENGLALKGDQIRLRDTDSAFDYELKASLLGGNGAFAHDSEKFYLSVSGGRTEVDARVLGETAKRFLWTSEVSSDDFGALAVNTHARAESSGAREEFLRAFRNDERIVGPGALAYVRTPSWPHEVRFSFEPSLGVEDSLFLAWSTQFRGTSSFNSVEDLTAMLESVAAVFEVRFKPLGEV